MNRTRLFPVLSIIAVVALCVLANLASAASINKQSTKEQDKKGYCCLDNRLSKETKILCNIKKGTYYPLYALTTARKACKKDLKPISTPLNRKPSNGSIKGYCCQDYRVSQLSKKSCKQGSGNWFSSKISAVKACTPKKGYCCNNNLLSSTTDVQCKRARGAFYSNRKKAERSCNKKGYCCTEGKLHNIDRKKCTTLKGKFLNDKPLAKRQCRPLKGYCCKEGKISRREKKSCKGKNVQFFSSPQKAKLGCVPPKGYCCIDSKVLRVDRKSCLSKKGSHHSSRLKAASFCRQERGFCCIQGELTSKNKKTCSKLKGEYFHSKQKALKDCADQIPRLSRFVKPTRPNRSFLADLVISQVRLKPVQSGKPNTVSYALHILVTVKNIGRKKADKNSLQLTLTGAGKDKTSKELNMEIPCPELKSGQSTTLSWQPPALTPAKGNTFLLISQIDSQHEIHEGNEENNIFKLPLSQTTRQPEQNRLFGLMQSVQSVGSQNVTDGVLQLRNNLQIDNRMGSVPRVQDQEGWTILLGAIIEEPSSSNIVAGEVVARLNGARSPDSDLEIIRTPIVNNQYRLDLPPLSDWSLSVSLKDAFFYEQTSSYAILTSSTGEVRTKNFTVHRIADTFDDPTSCYVHGAVTVNREPVYDYHMHLVNLDTGERDSNSARIGGNNYGLSVPAGRHGLQPVFTFDSPHANSIGIKHFLCNPAEAQNLHFDFSNIESQENELYVLSGTIRINGEPADSRVQYIFLDFVDDPENRQYGIPYDGSGSYRIDTSLIPGHHYRLSVKMRDILGEQPASQTFQLDPDSRWHTENFDLQLPEFRLGDLSLLGMIENHHGSSSIMLKLLLETEISNNYAGTYSLSVRLSTPSRTRNGTCEFRQGGTCEFTFPLDRVDTQNDSLLVEIRGIGDSANSTRMYDRPFRALTGDLEMDDLTLRYENSSNFTINLTAKNLGPNSSRTCSVSMQNARVPEGYDYYDSKTIPILQPGATHTVTWRGPVSVDNVIGWIIDSNCDPLGQNNTGSHRVTWQDIPTSTGVRMTGH